MTDLLEVRGIGQSFGGVRALDDVSLDVPSGSIVGLIGPNGAGKTTLFNIVSGLLPLQEGSIRFDSAEITHLPAHRRAALGVARSFQNLGLLQEETVETNVLSYLHRSAEYNPLDVVVRPWRRFSGEQGLMRRCGDILEEFGLAGDRYRIVRDLSFAKARLVEVAAVAAEKPRLMLLDEPTTGLDIGEVRFLATLLKDFRRSGVTILVVAHDVRFVMEICDYIYVLAEGRMLFHGKAAEIQTNEAVVAAYLGRTA